MWYDIEEWKPNKDGKYMCLIENDGKKYEAIRLFKKGHWFGGCRPFTDNEVILKWKHIIG